MTYDLNLVFHKIVESESLVAEPYTVDISFFKSLLKWLRDFCDSQKLVQGVRIYFDDNHRSTICLAAPILCETPFRGINAVPVESIGVLSHCSYEELLTLNRSGFEIVPHGFSHSALAIFRGDSLQPTPLGGLYRNMPSGKECVLTEEEVRFQLIESRYALGGFEPTEFVLPYGLYNQQTVSINKRHQVYKRLATCDSFLDAGECLRPRLLVTSDRSMDSTARIIKILEPRPSGCLQDENRRN